MRKLDKTISKGRYGIVFFLFLLLGTVALAPFRLNGSVLVLNLFIFGIPSIILFLCACLLARYPIRLLSVSLIICSLHVLWSMYVDLIKLFVVGGIRYLVLLIIVGGIRLIALWAIWSALVKIKDIMRDQVANSLDSETAL